MLFHRLLVLSLQLLVLLTSSFLLFIKFINMLLHLRYLHICIL
jgi:hypothetical protein